MHFYFFLFHFFICQPNEKLEEVLPGPQPALRPLAQDLAQSTRLSAQAWTAGLGWSCDSSTLEAELPGGGGGGPGPDTVIP